MSTFLSDLERELRAAHPRRRAARRRAAAGKRLREAPTVLAMVAVLAGAGAFVIAVGGEGTQSGTGRGGDDGQPPPATSTNPGDALPRGSVAVLNGTTRAHVGASVAEYLRVHTPVSRVGNAPDSETPETSVHHAPEFERQARRAADALGGVPVVPLSATIRNAAGAADVVVVAGGDIRGGRTFRLVRGRKLTTAGTVGVLDRFARRDVMIVKAKLKPGTYGLWLIDPDTGGKRFERLGIAPVADGRLDLVLSAIEPLEDRLLINRGTGRPGGLLQPADAFADLFCGGGDCDYFGR